MSTTWAINVNGENVDIDFASRLTLDVCDTNDQQSDFSVNESDLSPTEPDLIPRRSAWSNKGAAPLRFVTS